MNESLTAAIDQLIAFVGDRQEIPRAEMVGSFCTLDRSVFVLAHRRGLSGALPELASLERPMYEPDMPPVQFEGQTHLPGDWESGTFMPIPDQWRDRLLALRALAEAAGRTDGVRKGRPKKTDKDSATVVITALNAHHGYDRGGRVTNYTPATNRGLADLFNKGRKRDEFKLSTNALSRFLKACFPDDKSPAKRYKAACKSKSIGSLLALWNRQIPS